MRCWTTGLLLVALTCLSAALPASTARADFLSRILGAGERAAGKAAARATTALDHAAEHVRLRAPSGRQPVLAATATDEGHWTFVNAAGERYTAGTAGELARAPGILAPSGTDAPRLVITSDTLFRPTAVFKDLPKGTALEVLIADAVFPVELTATAPLVAVRPNLFVSAADRVAFDGALWQLSRPLSRADVRLITLEPGGPSTLSAAPRRDPATGNATTDRLDPRALGSLGAARGQTLLVTGRIDQDRLVYRAPAGTDLTVPLADLRAAARNADANLIVLSSSGTRQPGARNWLWQQVSVAGLDKALAHPTLGDAVSTMAGAPPMLVTPVLSGEGRVRLILTRRDVSSALPTAGWRDMLGDTLSEITGDLVIKGLEADMLGHDRQAELDWRIVPWLPSAVQYGYLALLILGVIGIPQARVWFAKLWPAERREEFSGAAGLLAARAVRLTAFVLIFMPAVSPLAGPLSLIRSLWNQAVGVAHVVTWPFRAIARTTASR